MIPERTKHSIDRYAKEHFPVGGFIFAVLSNNLVGAVGSADEENLKALPDIVAYVYNEIPSISWGTPEAVNKWLARRGDEASAR